MRDPRHSWGNILVTVTPASPDLEDQQRRRELLERGRHVDHRALAELCRVYNIKTWQFRGMKLIEGGRPAISRRLEAS